MLAEKTASTYQRRSLYEYDAFGTPEYYGSTDPNSFLYAGQLYDRESESYYLRARNYLPGYGRFATEDPVRDGLNWYVYCDNNPVMFLDYTGLFGMNTQLYIGIKNNPDVVKLQRALVSEGYLDVGEEHWGDFGQSTLNAVNNYKNDNNLWNFNEYEGIVGKTTWEYLGLPIDSQYETGKHIGTPEAYGRGFYSIADGASVKNGLSLGSVEAGMAKIGGDYRYGAWGLNTVSADAAMGFTAEYVGAQVGFRLISADGGLKIPLPFTDKSIYVGAEIELFGIGCKCYYEDGMLKVGATAVVGVDLIVGIK